MNHENEAFARRTLLKILHQFDCLYNQLSAYFTPQINLKIKSSWTSLHDSLIRVESSRTLEEVKSLLIKTALPYITDSKYLEIIPDYTDPNQTFIILSHEPNTKRKYIATLMISKTSIVPENYVQFVELPGTNEVVHIFRRQDDYSQRS